MKLFYLLMTLFFLFPCQARAVTLKLDVKRHILKNGLAVLTLERHHAPTISMYLYYKVGSKVEKKGLTGLSHFFEHSMFKGTKNYPAGEFDRLLENEGCHTNAFTTKDYTAYTTINLNRGNLDLGLKLEADRMQNLLLTEEKIAAEKKVVLEERKIRTENSLQGTIWEKFDRTIYPTHPYGNPIIGWEEDIKRYNPADCQLFYQTYYSPGNAILVIVGDFKAKEALKSVKKYFEKIPAVNLPQLEMAQEKEAEKPRRVIIKKIAQNEFLYLGFLIPPLTHPDIYCLDVLENILGTGESSRLYQRLVYQKELATAASAGALSLKDSGTFLFNAYLKPKISAAQAEEIVWQEIEKIKAKGISPKELRKSKNQILSSLIFSLKRNSRLARWLGYYELMKGGWEDLITDIEQYEKVTSQDIKRVAKKYFDKKRSTTVILKPKR